MKIIFSSYYQVLDYFKLVLLKGVLKAQDETRNGYFKQELVFNGFATPAVDYR